jgi:short-subunit dehydrogenase
MVEWILITGSSKGLGRELALVFARGKYNVIIHGRNSERLKDVKEEILRQGVECEIVTGDICLNQTIRGLSEIAKEKNISILINNAARGFIKSFERVNERELKEILETDLFSIIKLTREIYSQFLESKFGTIINVNGMAGIKPGKNQSIYCASKYGLRGFSDSLRYEAKEHDIRVIGVHLSGMKTEMYTEGGVDASNCMEPKEVAETIFDLTKKKDSLMIDEVLISRMRY